MKIKKKTFKSYLLVLIAIIISGVLIFLSNNIYIHLLAFVILVFSSIIIVEFDISHPYFWYSFIFSLYALSYPIVFITGNTYDIFTYTKSLMITQWIALSIVLLIVGPGKTDYEVLKSRTSKALSSKPIMIIIWFIVALTIAQISSGGYTHKEEIYSQGSMLIFIGFRAVLALLILYTVNLTRTSLLYDSIDKKMTTYVFISIFFMVYFSGERDLLIRFFISLLFIYHIIINNRKLNKTTVFIGLFSLASIPILAQFKYFGLTGVRSTSEYNFFMRFLTSEFQSASKNLQILLLDESTKGKFKGVTIISSILRSLNLDQIFDVDIITAGGWFNNTYFSANRSAQGFTLIGEGYVNFGYLGIIMVFALVGILIRLLYKKSNKSVYYFSFYILSIPVFLYSIRADVANIISPLLKQNLVTILLVHYFMEVLYVGNNKKNSYNKLNSNNDY